MHYVDFLVTLLPSVAAIAAGWLLSRFSSFKGSALSPLLRYALVPALLFTVLLGPVGQRTFVLVALVGVATALAGHWAVRLLPRLIGHELSPAASRLNLLGLTLPLVAVSLGGRGSVLMALAVIFVAVTITLIFSEHGEGGFAVLIRQPWLYAALAALLFRLLDVPTPRVVTVISPLAQASFAILLVQLGASLHPTPPWRASEAWMSSGVRLVVGLGLALLAAWLLPLPVGASRAVVLAGLAPAASAEQAFLLSGESAKGERATSALSTVVAFAAILVWGIFRG